MKKFSYSLGLSLLALAAVTVQSCKVEEITKENFDSTITALKNVDVPVPASLEVKLGDVITAGASSIISVNASGDYQISSNLADMEAFSFDGELLSLPTLSGDFNNSITLSVNSIPANTPLYSGELTPAQKAALIILGADMELFDKLQSQEVSFNSPVLDFSISELPEIIKGIKSAGLGGTLSFDMTTSGLPFTKVTLKPGTKITFPSFMKFASCNNPGFTLQSDGYTLIASNNVDVYDGVPIEFELGFDSLVLGDAGTATNGSLSLKDKISISGSMSVSPDDFTGSKVPFDLTPYGGSGTIDLVAADTPISSISVSSTFETNGVNLTNAEVKLDCSQIPGFDSGFAFDIPTADFPSFMTDGSSVVKLSDVQINFTVNSQLPFDFGFGATLNAKNGTSVAHSFDLGTPSRVFKANSTSVYSVGTHASGTEGQVVYKKVDGIGDILSPIPSRIEATGFTLDFDDTKWYTITPGSTSFKLDLVAPVAFASGSQVSISLADVSGGSSEVAVPDDIRWGNKIKVDVVALKFKAENSIPFKFSITVIGKDANKNAFVTNTVVVPSPSATEATKVSNVEAALDFTGTGKSIDDLRYIDFELQAIVDDVCAGLRLKPSQSLKVSEVAINLPNGVSTEVF